MVPKRFVGASLKRAHAANRHLPRSRFTAAPMPSRHALADKTQADTSAGRLRAAPAEAAAQGRPVVLTTPGPKASDAVSLAFIHPNLYLTSLSGARCFKGSVAIVAAGGRETTDYLRTHPAEYRAFVNVDDTPFMSFAHFAAAFGKSSDLLQRALATGHPTFLHCHQGINRSVATALVYVLKHTDLDYEACLRQVRQANAAHRALPALTNPAFQTHLRRFAKELAERGGAWT
jgi:hypothetical protein